MIVMLNGSFGVGKSTVAQLLCQSIPRSAVYNPELVGSVLMRLPKWMFEGAGTDDFQDIELWRRSMIGGVKLFSRVVSGPAIVPMTFSSRLYFDEVVAGIRENDPELKVFCLRASLTTLSDRLARRNLCAAEKAWVARRNIECARAHVDTHFGEPIETEGRSALQVAGLIRSRLSLQKFH